MFSILLWSFINFNDFLIPIVLIVDLVKSDPHNMHKSINCTYDIFISFNNSSKLIITGVNPLFSLFINRNRLLHFYAKQSKSSDITYLILSKFLQKYAHCASESLFAMIVGIPKYSNIVKHSYLHFSWE